MLRHAIALFNESPYRLYSVVMRFRGCGMEHVPGGVGRKRLRGLTWTTVSFE